MSTLKQKTLDADMKSTLKQDGHSKTQRHPTPTRCLLQNTKTPDADKISTVKRKDSRRRQYVHSETQRHPTPTRCMIEEQIFRLRTVLIVNAGKAGHVLYVFVRHCLIIATH